MLSIKAWGTTFEDAESRKLKRLPWVRLPALHDSRAYRRLMANDRGLRAYGVFVALVRVAATCNPRGELRRDDHSALDTTDLAVMTGIPESLISDSLEVLCSKEIGWISCGSPEDLPLASQLPMDRGDDVRGEKRRSTHTAGAEARGSVSEDEPRGKGDERPATRSGYAEAARFHRPPDYPMPADFEPDAKGRAYATARGMDPDAVRDRLRNVAEARSWMRSDWQAAYREQVDRLADWNQRDGTSPRAVVGPKRDEPAKRSVNTLAERLKRNGKGAA